MLSSDFQNGKYVAEIDENLPDGEPVIQVFASDADRVDDKGYADIRYRMDDNRFDIEPETVSTATDYQSRVTRKPVFRVSHQV